MLHRIPVSLRHAGLFNEEWWWGTVDEPMLVCHARLCQYFHLPRPRSGAPGWFVLSDRKRGQGYWMTIPRRSDFGGHALIRTTKGTEFEYLMSTALRIVDRLPGVGLRRRFFVSFEYEVPA